MKKIFIMTLCAGSFLILLGALCTPLLAYYKIEISNGLYSFYHSLCKGGSSCFLINGYAIPLCARCLGIWAGVFLTLVLYFENIKINKNLCNTLFAIVIIELILECFRLIPVNNWIMLLSGVFVGIIIIVSFLRMEIKFKKEY